jgi:hypothetical protein
MSRGPLRQVGKSVSDAVNRLELVRALKYARSHVIDHWYRRVDRSTGHACAEQIRASGCRRMAFTVAFNCPWVVDALVASWSRHVSGFELMVVDNSKDSAARVAHETICRQRGTRYLSLPPNREWNPNRSHALALNWVWWNIVRRSGLEVAGFVDHDLIPVGPIDLAQRTAHFDAYGLHYVSKLRPEFWGLWAGYTFLRPSASRGSVDFKPEHHVGLDTGGRNWKCFYRDLDASRVGAVTSGSEPLLLGPEGESVELQRLDGAFLHLGAASYCPRYAQEGFRRRLMDAIWTMALPDGTRIAPVP